MFGFPEHLGDWQAHHYLRIFTFIIVYISVRPLLQKMYTRLGERQREREKAQYEDEQIRKHKQIRIREKLGIVNADGSNLVDSTGASTTPQPDPATTTTTAASALRKRPQQSQTTKTRKDEIADTMDSDEDVSDLLQ